MSKIFAELKNNPFIISIEPVRASAVLPEFQKKAAENTKVIESYRIEYKSQGHRVVGFIAHPKRGTALPCILYCRGGSHEFGKIRPHSVIAGKMAELAKAGYIVIASQYSGNDGSEGVDEMGGSDLEDLLTLYKILQKHPRADVKRIGAFGGSRGGMMCFLLMRRVKWLKAVVVVSPLTNLVTHIKFRPKMKQHYREMFGGALSELKKRSVAYWVDELPKRVPILLLQGTSDWRVDPTATLQLATDLYKHNVPYRLLMLEGADHGLNEFPGVQASEAVAWFHRFVRDGEPMPNLQPHGD